MHGIIEKYSGGHTHKKRILQKKLRKLNCETLYSKPMLFRLMGLSTKKNFYTFSHVSTITVHRKGKGTILLSPKGEFPRVSSRVAEQFETWNLSNLDRKNIIRKNIIIPHVF